MQLGSQGLTVTKSAFGCMGITAFYGPEMENKAAQALLQGVYDAGCRHFDTAEIYTTGNPFGPHTPDKHYNEVTLGRFLATVPRDSFTVATKFMPGIHPGTDLKSVEDALDASLTKLGLTCVDLYYCHRMPKTLEALLEWMRSCKALVAKGKMRYVGLSEVGPSWLRAAHAVHPVTAIQQEWSLLTRVCEPELVPCCAELGIGIVAYSPLARNLLAKPADTEAPKDWRSSLPRFQAENFEKNRTLVQQLEALGAAKQKSNAQLSLAWLYAKASELKVTVLPIPGTTKLANAQSNIAAAEITLEPADMVTLEALGASVAGARADKGYLASALEGQPASL